MRTPDLGAPSMVIEGPRLRAERFDRAVDLSMPDLWRVALPEIERDLFVSVVRAGGRFCVVVFDMDLRVAELLSSLGVIRDEVALVTTRVHVSVELVGVHELEMAREACRFLARQVVRGAVPTPPESAGDRMLWTALIAMARVYGSSRVKGERQRAAPLN